MLIGRTAAANNVPNSVRRFWWIQELHRTADSRAIGGPCFMNGRIEPRHWICGHTFYLEKRSPSCLEAYASRPAQGFAGGQFVAGGFEGHMGIAELNIGVVQCFPGSR